MFKPRQSSLNKFRTRLTAAAVAAGLIAPFATLAGEAAFTRTAEDVEWGPCPEFMPEGCALAVLQGNPAEPNADALFKLPANATAPAHWHTSAERMVLLSGEMQVQYEGQEPVVLTPGTYAYGPPRVSHSATCKSDEDCVLFIAFEEAVDAMASEE
jgi:quercetin dioxygenase-like cupin family protein